MNKQRKTVITTTYNEMGIVIDTKVEEVTQPNLQPTCNQLATDTISRQAAIDEEIRCAMCRNQMKTDRGCDGNCQVDEKLCKEIIRIIEKHLPSAQPERKKGKWKFEKMKHIINGEVRDVIICSECDGGWFRYDISDNTVQNIPNFCPNCGADMRGAKVKCGDEDTLQGGLMSAT